MKSILALGVLLLLMSGCANHPARLAECSERGTTSTVTLQPRFQEPALYLIAEHYAILLRTDDVMSLLEARREQVGGMHGADERLLAAIKAKLPLAEETDLLQFSFHDNTLFERPQYIAAALLSAGKAAVVDMWGDPRQGTTLSSVIQISFSNGAVEGRHFCAADGESVLSVIDMILD